MKIEDKRKEHGMIKRKELGQKGNAETKAGPPKWKIASEHIKTHLSVLLLVSIVRQAY